MAKTCDPEFVDLNGLEAGYGIGRSHAYLLIRDGAIKSISLRRGGNVRGKRLIEVESVRRFLSTCPADVNPHLSEQLRRARRGEKTVKRRPSSSSSLASSHTQNNTPRMQSEHSDASQ
jgi:hypothetical protein